MFLSKYWARICKIMPDDMYLKWQYKHIWNRKLDLKNPRTYAEKLSYLKINEQDGRLSKLVDKYEVRNFVEEKIGASHLIPLIGVYDSTDDIPWNELPEEYVLKCTHDSASVILHINGKVFDKEKAIESLNKHLLRNMYWYSREYPYKDVEPRIVCEKFISNDGNPPSDYKIMCFDGNAKYIIVDKDRFGNHKRDFYDRNWVKQDLSSDHPQSNNQEEKPEKLDEMIKYAECLSKGFKHVRVDFYYVNKEIYFGEMTFFPWGGPIWFEPEKWNYILGDLIKL